MDEVGGGQLGQEGGEDVGEQDETLGDVGTDEVLGGGEDDDVQDIIDESFWFVC